MAVDADVKGPQGSPHPLDLGVQLDSNLTAEPGSTPRPTRYSNRRRRKLCLNHPRLSTSRNRSCFGPRQRPSTKFKWTDQARPGFSQSMATAYWKTSPLATMLVRRTQPSRWVSMIRSVMPRQIPRSSAWTINRIAHKQVLDHRLQTGDETGQGHGKTQKRSQAQGHDAGGPRP